MTQLIHSSTKEIEFNKNFKTQLRLNNVLIISNFVIWLAAIFLLGSCGPSAYPTHQSTLDKRDITALQCLKISQPKRTLAKRPLTSRQSFVSVRMFSKRHQ